MSRWRYSGFGLGLESDFPLLPVRVGAAAGATPTVTIRRASLQAVEGSLSAAPELIWETSFEERSYRMHRGCAGDHRFEWVDRAVFHLTPGADVLTCGFRDHDDPGAVRLLLDTVLWSVSLLHGYELLHASAVCCGDEAVAFVAGTGGGKTSLAAELVGRGAELLSDDVVAISDDAGRVLAHPGPPVMNLPLEHAGPAPLDIGQRLAVLGDEAWVNVEAAATTPRRLTAVYVLDRGDHGDARVEEHPVPLLALLPHAFGFPGSKDRQGRQFEILSDLIADTPVLRLSAGPSCTPDVLADVIEHQLITHGSIAGVA